MQPTNLADHPEGGRFKEVFRSNSKVTATDGRSRNALTHIYFSLRPGEVSRFHKVASDEVWNLYRGEGVHLHIWKGSGKPPETITLSAGSNTFCHVIPAGAWQAAEPISGEVLVGCSVAPGFEFEDFEMIEPGSENAGMLAGISSKWEKFM